MTLESIMQELDEKSRVVGGTPMVEMKDVEAAISFVFMHLKNHNTNIYVYDTEMDQIMTVDSDTHHALSIDENGLHYRNLQNGDGGCTEERKECGYVILHSRDGRLEDEFGIVDKRYEDRIRKYLEEGI